MKQFIIKAKVGILTIFYIFPVMLAFAAPTLTPPGDSASLTNPLAITSIKGFLETLLQIVIVLSVPIIVFFIIYAGFLYVTARGNAEQVKKATTALTYSIIGGVLIIGAMVIAEIIGNLITDFAA